MVWEVALGMQIAGGFMSSRAKRKAGKAALREARAQAAEVRLQKQDVALLATQAHEDQQAQFAEMVAYNTAAVAAGGRVGRSAAALKKREQQLYGKSVDRLRLQEAREKAALEKEAKAIERRGVQARKSYRAQARNTLFDTAYKASAFIPSGTSEAPKEET
jgi:hypothetical protein